MRSARIISGSLVALLGLLLVGLAVLGSPPGLLADEFFNKILWVSIGVLLLAFAAVILLR